MSNDVQRPFQRAHSDAELEVPPSHEVAFEEARGVTNVEVRPGFAGIQVSGLTEPLSSSQLEVLKKVADSGVSIDFLKLTPDGLSFLVPESARADAERGLGSAPGQFEVKGARSVVLVHAANMRDEEGLIARIVSTAIASGAEIDHMGDMHDRILLVVSQKDAEGLARSLESAFGGEA